MKTSENTESKTQPGEGRVGICGSKAGRDESRLDRSRIDNGEFDSGKIGDNEIGKKVQKLFKSKNISKKTIGSDFLTPRAKLAFTKLRQAFVKALIPHHFDPERHIWIKTDVSGYVIGEVLSQLTSDNLGRWYPVVFFLQKMISAETRYKTYNGELLAIIETFKTWRHYPERSQHEVIVLTNYNNLRRFMDTNSLSYKQVRWAQKLSCYYFQIDYHQGKANKTADTLSLYSQRSAEKEEAFQAENIKILHRLQSLLTNVNLSSLIISKPSLLPLQACHLSTKSSYTEPMFFYSSTHSGTLSKVT